MDIAVVGAGYVGLVTGACLAKLGHHVRCLEVDQERVARLVRGEVPISEPQLDSLVSEGLADGNLTFGSEQAILRGARLVIIAVGTLDEGGSWTDEKVRATISAIAADPDAPRSIVVRSTLLPGTAERLADHASQIDPFVEVAVNPEFTREGAAVADFMEPDRVVIGTRDPDSHVVADLRQIYQPLGVTIVVTDLTSAETIKVASNVFLAAKITFANELARLCAATGASIAVVAEGIGLDRRIGRAFLSAGPGFGGSCLPVQARALPALARRYGVDVPLMAAIDESNEDQVLWIVDAAEQALGRSVQAARVAVLGLTFKAGTDDIRESPALRIVVQLASRGAVVSIYDPKGAASSVAFLSRKGIDIVPAATPLDAARGVDAVIVATEWPVFREIDWYETAQVMRGDVVVDARGILDPHRVAGAGLRIVGLVDRGSALIHLQQHVTVASLSGRDQPGESDVAGRLGPAE